ncbi:hypothetical protein C8F04DRAFT_1368626 [Mycena alexandri]|uniref:Uncharacterized protein n=1 Tax=Mycena alexandri TaxID=1745969 RepID=A0AAD6WZ52_9AGAR|nr:hypothetical protein C8F04DRAFT_1368626 [Mycena alexandri]
MFFPPELPVHQALYVLGVLISLYPILVLHANQRKSPRQPAVTGWMKSIRALLTGPFSIRKNRNAMKRNRRLCFQSFTNLQRLKASAGDGGSDSDLAAVGTWRKYQRVCRHCWHAAGKCRLPVGNLEGCHGQKCPPRVICRHVVFFLSPTTFKDFLLLLCRPPAEAILGSPKSQLPQIITLKLIWPPTGVYGVLMYQKWVD